MTSGRFRSPRPDELGRLGPEARRLYDALTSGPRATGEQPFPLTDADGALHGPFGLMLLQPGVGGPLQELGAAIRYQGELTAREREIAILAVAAATGSGFEAWAHARVAAAIGMDAAEIAAVADGTFAGADERERLCHDLARRLVHERTLDDAGFEQASAALGRADLLELVVLVGYYATLALMMDVFDVGLPDESPVADE
ncbi:hypothetical protein GCM10009788_09120 [Nocardioides humi]|uniref:Carboxymuconolactone decarboxylase-like domain-containing protein n=1 Tax=Nocardioides humi TaxID=449461 RepID=A0ABN1ZY94_9ACTN